MNNYQNISSEFNTREEYLAWRTAWREEYKNQSQLIRDTKQVIREAHRTGGDASSYQSQLHRHRARANSLMQARMAGKERMLQQRAAMLAAAA